MKERGYASLLQQYRQQEQARNKDFTQQALDVYRLRIESIQNSAEPDDRKERQMSQAFTQWQTFMQRDMPAQG